MWWNLFSSSPCWVCHNNRFYFCGICWPLMCWVFMLPEMVPALQQRFHHLFLGRLRSAPEPVNQGSSSQLNHCQEQQHRPVPVQAIGKAPAFRKTSFPSNT